MPSPFPGMDPYLEDPSHWPDVHQSFITYTRDALQPQLRPRYNARIGERVYVEVPRTMMYPDVFVVQHSVTEREAAYTTATQTPTVTQPAIIEFPPVRYREPYIEIIHAGSGEVITVIEILSPANKSGEGREQYVDKQQRILASNTHLVEIDLLTEGDHTIAIPYDWATTLQPYRYLISIRRAPHQPRAEAYPTPLEKRLPVIPIPLRAPDPDVVLDLQAVFNQCYDNGGYQYLIDYRKPPKAPLSAEETAWVDGLLKGKNLR